MIGVEYVPPTAPRLLIVNVLPRKSSSAKLAVADVLGDRGQLPGDFGNGQPVGVAERRHDQAAVGIDGDAQVDVVLVDDPLVLHVDRGVDHGVVAQRHGDGLDHKRQRSQLDAAGCVIVFAGLRESVPIP